MKGVKQLGGDEGFMLVGNLRVVCKDVDGVKLCHAIKLNDPHAEDDGYKIVEGVRVEKITKDGKTAYKTVAVKTTTKTVDKGEPLGTASITLAGDVIMLYPILTPVVLVTGGVGLVASLVDSDAANWIDTASKDTLNFVDNVTSSVVDALNPSNW